MRTLVDGKRRNDYLRASTMSVMTGPSVPLVHILPTVLLCLTLAGAADAAAPPGSVIGWGQNNAGQATPPQLR